MAFRCLFGALGACLLTCAVAIRETGNQELLRSQYHQVSVAREQEPEAICNDSRFSYLNTSTEHVHPYILGDISATPTTTVGGPGPSASVALFLAARSPTIQNEASDRNRMFHSEENFCHIFECWLSSGFRVEVRYVTSTEEAQDALLALGDSDIKHLTLIGHGSPHTLTWSMDAEGAMKSFLTSLSVPVLKHLGEDEQMHMMNSTRSFFETVRKSLDPKATIFFYACLQADRPLRNDQQNMLSYVSALVRPIQVLGIAAKLQNVLLAMPDQVSFDTSHGAHCHAHDLATHAGYLRRSESVWSTGEIRPPHCETLTVTVQDSAASIGWGLADAPDSAAKAFCQGWSNYAGKEPCLPDQKVSCYDRAAGAWILASFADADASQVVSSETLDTIPSIRSQKIWCAVRVESFNFSDWFPRHFMMDPPMSEAELREAGLLPDDCGR